MTTPPPYWLPLRLSATAQNLQLSWLFTQQHRFTEPFFDDSIAVCKRLFAENKAADKPHTGIEVLLQPTPMPVAKTSVILHHVSRCGSTLIAQLMALNEQMIVLSEVPVLDDVLQLLPEQKKPVYFNAALQWLSQCRIGTEQQVLVKADAWQLFQHEHIKRSCPDAAYVLLYRHPYEVWQSHQKSRGMHMVPGMLPANALPAPAHDLSPGDLDGYCAHVLEHYFRSMYQLAVDHPQHLMLNYAQGPMALTLKTAQHAGIALSETLQAQMQTRSQFHAKRPGEAFAEKMNHQSIPDSLATAMAYYHQLEALRLQQSIAGK